MALTPLSKDKIIALSGNPNVGKSTVFNALTGLNQHTGNWPGKTVTNAEGHYTHQHKHFTLVDLPGTYSLMASSAEEEVARDFICFGQPDTIIVVADATCLERNLNLLLQILEVKKEVILCINLLDEAKKKKIIIDLEKLSATLGIPVIGTSARSGQGLNKLMEEVYAVSFDRDISTPSVFNYPAPIEEAILILQPIVEALAPDALATRWLSLKLLDLDFSFNSALTNYLGFNLLENKSLLLALEAAKNILRLNHIDENNLRDTIVSTVVLHAENIYKECVLLGDKAYHSRDRKIDKVLTSRLTGIPIMLMLLGFIFWLTIIGANYPSELLSTFLFWIEGNLLTFFEYIGTPPWVHGLLVLGIYRTLAWVVSVMLPPMAIFFPLFTLLEDSGYLPRIAFNMDQYFKKACAHGKQSLTMCMGFGCNACGVIGCRIIDSPRERLIAILTNNFVPCNGRFPTIIAIITMFFVGSILGPFQSLFATLLLLGVILSGVFMTLFMSKLLSKTLLKGMPSSFALELPPYRRPQIGKVIVRSIFDRTLFVLGRAVVVAAPAGLILWLMSNIIVADASILNHCTQFLDPFARIIGLDGVILMAFILGFPANEIVIPIMIMSYMATGSLTDTHSLEELRYLLINNGWTLVTAINVILFSLFHFPCGTTCWTIKKETQSLKWTFIAFLLPTATGIIICFLVTTLARLLHLL